MAISAKMSTEFCIPFYSFPYTFIINFNVCSTLMSLWMKARQNTIDAMWKFPCWHGAFGTNQVPVLPRSFWHDSKLRYLSSSSGTFGALKVTSFIVRDFWRTQSSPQDNNLILNLDRNTHFGVTWKSEGGRPSTKPCSIHRIHKQVEPFASPFK